MRSVNIFNPNNPIVVGYQNSVIQDFNLEKFYSIPNAVLQDLNSNLNSGDAMPYYITDLFNNFIELGMIVSVPHDLRFNFFRNELFLTQPNKLSNITIEFNHKLNYNLFMENIHRSYFLITLENEFGIEKLFDLISRFDSNFYFLHLDIPVEATPAFIKLAEELNLPQIIEIHFYGVEMMKFETNLYNIFFIKEKMNELNFESAGNIDSFEVNNLFFNEAKNKNVFFYKRGYISFNGEFSNSIMNFEHSIQINSLQKTNHFNTFISSEKFIENGNAKKDATDICKHCEYRYNCVDNRIPLKKKNTPNEWYHPSECDYNPYIGEMKGSANYKSIKDIGEFIDQKYIINSEKLSSYFNNRK